MLVDIRCERGDLVLRDLPDRLPHIAVVLAQRKKLARHSGPLDALGRQLVAACADPARCCYPSVASIVDPAIARESAHCHRPTAEIDVVGRRPDVNGVQVEALSTLW